MKPAWTTNSNIVEPTKTVEEMLAAIEQAISGPRLAGSIMGVPVYIDGRMPDRMVEIRSGEQTIRFRADHPYLDGTHFAEIVRR